MFNLYKQKTCGCYWTLLDVSVVAPRGIEPLFPAIEASVLTTGHGASE